MFEEAPRNSGALPPPRTSRGPRIGAGARSLLIAATSTVVFFAAVALVVGNSPGWEDFRRSTTPEFAQSSWEHLVRSHCFTIEKAARLLGYAPRYEPDAAVLESVRWLIDHGRLQVA